MPKSLSIFIFVEGLLENSIHQFYAVTYLSFLPKSEKCT